MKKKTIIIIGLNRFGSNLAIHLQKMGNEVIALDEREEKVRRIADKITHAAIGNPADEDVLRSLDVDKADVVIVALTKDIQSGVLVTLMLKEMGAENVIAECTSDIHGRILAKVGADKVIYPERDMGERLAKSLNNSDIMDYIDLSDEYSIMEIRVPKSWSGKSLLELNVRANYGITVIAYRDASGNICITPDPKMPLVSENKLIIIGPDATIEKIINE